MQYLKAAEVQGIPGLQIHHIAALGAFNPSESVYQGQVMRDVFRQLLTSSKCPINFELLAGNVFS